MSTAESRALLVAAIVACAGIASAAPPEDAEAKAERLHARALSEAQARRWDSALELWDAAFVLHPSWKYAYNQASSCSYLKRWMDAWTACERAGALGVPDVHRAAVTKTCDAVSAELLRTRAWLDLRVEPPDAEVTLSGEPWPSPRQGWSERASSVVVVSRSGYVTVSETWAHAVGQRSSREIRLIAVPRKGGLVIRGAPAGADVLIGGAPMGSLPEAVRSDLEPGTYPVRVTRAGFEPFETRVTISAGETQSVTATLVPLRVGPETSIVAHDTSGPRLATWAWTALGTGVALAGIGGGLLIHARGLADDAGALDRAAPGYLDAYAETRQSFESSQNAGWALVGVGAAAAVTSVVLFFLDRGLSGEAMRPAVTPSGAGFVYSFF